MSVKMEFDNMDGLNAFTPTSTSPKVTVADPTTLEGQQKGAILVVKWCSRPSPALSPLVGDHVKVLGFRGVDGVGVENLRSGEQFVVQWKIFFPVPFYGRCSCNQGECRCIYESFEMFQARQPRRGNTVIYEGTVPGNVRVSVPWTLNGQRTNAILLVKRKPWYPIGFENKLGVEVGDSVQVLGLSKDNSMTLTAKNLRTGAEGNLHWSTFRP